jgi:hypothetical protein
MVEIQVEARVDGVAGLEAERFRLPLADEVVAQARVRDPEVGRVDEELLGPIL